MHALTRERTLQRALHSMGPLRIQTLGATEVQGSTVSDTGSWLGRRPGQLLKYLVAERSRIVKVDEIGESIWPGSDYAISGSVRYYVHVLRRTLEPDGSARSPASYVLCRSGGYMLNADRIEVDVDEFTEAIGNGLRILPFDRSVAVPLIERALSLYKGDFLADEPYATWAMPERQCLHELACEGISALADARIGELRLREANELLVRLARMQPYDEDVHRRLIELDLRRGRRSDAMRRYTSWRVRLRRDFGEEPAFTPAELVGRTGSQ